MEYATDAGDRTWSASFALHQRLVNLRMGMKMNADAIRAEIKSFGPHDFDMALTIDEAVALADDTTDIAVVNAGFANASGIPGGACYVEVGTSNFSKANPETGRIDKDPSGKWIKGTDYQEPDLKAVLVEHGFNLAQPVNVCDD
jgi:hypothetical protein